MLFRQLGRSGLSVSLVGLGCNNFGVRCDFDRSRDVVHEALDQGITFFDTADIYGGQGGSESFLGKILGPKRDEIVLATKFGMNMGTNDLALGSRRYIRRAIEASLKRLQTDYVDLYQYHAIDPLTPLEETLSALQELVREGKVRYIGCSNFAGWQLAESYYLARTMGGDSYISVQNHYSILARELESEVMGAAERYGLGVLPFYPLEAGLLTGKFVRGGVSPSGTRLASRPEVVENANFDLIEALERFAAATGRELIDVAFGYLVSKPQVSSVIAGATSAEQVARNVATLANQLSEDEVEAVEKVLAPWANRRNAALRD